MEGWEAMIETMYYIKKARGGRRRALIDRALHNL